MCHSSPHMLICGGLRVGGFGEGARQRTEEKGGGVFFIGFVSWAFLVWLSKPICVSAHEQVMQLQTSLLLLCFYALWSVFSPTSTVVQVLYTICQQAIRCRRGWTQMECMCLIFDLSCSIPCGWVADKCVWNCSLFANLSRSNQFVATEIGRRLGWRRKDSQKVFDHGWYALWRHRYLWSCIPSKEILLKTKCFQGAEGFLSFNSTVSTRKTVASISFLPL